VREIERRIRKWKRTTPAARRAGQAPIGVPDSFSERQTMLDLQALAFASGITQVFAFSSDATRRIASIQRIRGAFHSSSHHGEREDRIRFPEDQHLSRQHGPVSAGS
jgi:hypothetical protein